MRPSALAWALSLSLFAGRSVAEPLIIDVKPQRKQGARARVPEVRVAMGDSETSRRLAPAILEQLKSLGYEVHPTVDFEGGQEGKLAKALLRFEILRSGDSCFVTAKASEPKAEMSFWRWETGDDLRECGVQIEEAVRSLAAARPPARPKTPPPAPAPIVDLAALAVAEPADGGSDDAVAPVLTDDAGEVADAGGEALPQDAAARAGESEGRDAAATAAGDADPGEAEAAAPVEAPERKACGCGATGGAAPLAALLVLGALRRRGSSA